LGILGNKLHYYINRTQSTEKKKKRTERQTGERAVNTYTQITRNVREVTNSECVRQT